MVKLTNIEEMIYNRFSIDTVPSDWWLKKVTDNRNFTAFHNIKLYKHITKR